MAKKEKQAKVLYKGFEDRAWLNPQYGIALISLVVGAVKEGDTWTDISLTIGDCNRQINLDFNFSADAKPGHKDQWDSRSFEEVRKKIGILQYYLSKLDKVALDQNKIIKANLIKQKALIKAEALKKKANAKKA